METISFAHGWDPSPQESGRSAGTPHGSSLSSSHGLSLSSSYGSSYSHLPQSDSPSLSNANSSWSKALLPCLPPAVMLMSLQAGAIPAVAATYLTPGMDNADVASLQYKLARLGYFQEHNTGYFGDRTEAAVRKFQQAEGLQVDGIVGDETWEALKSQSVAIPIAVVSAPDSLEGFAGFETSGVAIDTTHDGTSDPAGDSTHDPEIWDIQTHLQNLGYNPGPIDGILGPQTTAAIQDFQLARGLIVDGIVGPETWGALQQSIHEAPDSNFETLPKMTEVVFDDLGADYEILPVPELPF